MRREKREAIFKRRPRNGLTLGRGGQTLPFYYIHLGPEIGQLRVMWSQHCLFYSTNRENLVCSTDYALLQIMLVCSTAKQSLIMLCRSLSMLYTDNWEVEHNQTTIEHNQTAIEHNQTTIEHNKWGSFW